MDYDLKTQFETLEDIHLLTKVVLEKGSIVLFRGNSAYKDFILVKLPIEYHGNGINAGYKDNDYYYIPNRFLKEVKQ